MKLRAANSEACVNALDSIFRNLQLVEIAKLLNSQEGQWATVEYPGDAVKDEQAIVNGYMQMVDYENGAKLPLVPVPALIDGQLPELKRAPEHCEHTDQVLEALGYSADKIMDMKVAGVIA